MSTEHEHHEHHAEHWKPQRSLRDYLPLIVIVGIAILSACAVTSDGRSWMRQFMGIFLVIFAMLKLFDVSGFADGFQRYDLIAKRFRPYALVYPFVELALGLAFQANLYPVVTRAVLLVVMTIGAISEGITQANDFRHGAQIHRLGYFGEPFEDPKRAGKDDVLIAYPVVQRPKAKFVGN